MKTKVLFYTSILSLIPFANVNAQFTAANIFYSGDYQSPFNSLTNLSTSSTEKVNPTSFADMSNWVLGKYNGAYPIKENQIFTFVEANRETKISGIYWGDVAENAVNNPNLHIYNSGGLNDTFTLTNGITVDCSTAIGSEVKIRRRQNYGNFTVNVGDVHAVKKSVISFGAKGSGEYLTSLNFLGDINLNAGSVLNIVSNEITFASNTSINLNSSSIVVGLGVHEMTGNIKFNWSNFDTYSNNVAMNVTGTSGFSYGGGWDSPGKGFVSLGDINLASSDVNFDFAIYSNHTDGKYVKSINSTVDGGVGSKVYIKTAHTELNVESMKVAVETLQLSSILHISGDYEHYYSAGKSWINLDGTSDGFIVDGSFILKNSSSTQLTFGARLGTANTGNYSFGGMVSDSNSFMTSAFVGGDRNTVGKSVFTLTGDKVYHYDGKITDMSYNETLGSIGANGSFSIVKNGTGTQYFRGQTWYRGDTIVNSGKLYIRADLEGRMPAADAWGIGSLILNGGTFGACGKNSELGTVYLNNLNLNGGTMEFNVISGNSDKFIFTDNTASLITAASEDFFKFTFVLEGIIYKGENIKIFDWNPELGDLSFDVSKFIATVIADGENLEAIFSYAEDGGLNVMFVDAIPEPATVAALIGALALGIAIYRRRK